MGVLDAPFRFTSPTQVPLAERRQLPNAFVNTPTGSFSLDLSSASFAAPGYDLGGTQVAVGDAWWVESVTLSSNKQCLWNFNSLGATAITGITTGLVPAGINVIADAWRPVTVPVGTLIRGGVSGTVFDTRIRNIWTTDKTDCCFSVSLTGFMFTDDFDFGARKTILFIGDSTWAGTGPSTKDTFIPWMIRKYYSDKGIRCRMVNKSMSGTTSVGHATLVNRGFYDIDDVALVCYGLGINDAIQGTAGATYQANVAAAITWARLRWPSCKFLAIAPNGLENNTTETAMAALRTKMSAAVTAASDANVLYVSDAAAFDRTDTSNFASSDSSGNHIHPNDQGCNAEYTNILKPFLDSNIPTI